MANVPYPLSGETIADLRRQVGELIRELYEERIGGAALGDVFSITGDVLTLELASSSGLTKSGNDLALDPTSDGGLQVTSSGASIKNLSTGGLESDASGEQIKLDGVSLSLSASGLKVSTRTVGNGGTTADRPATPIQFEHYFDTDLGYRIDYDGSNWVNASGAIV
ncbi:hypothetical protein [Neptuniibacter sp.]|uniref:hypothetical protein n=1 Tax=Neptuniibacter sp. TaxID=1962643 RepID=UPI0026282196|nr:hypothetical protein [Neptuniibacter sp.]MCP4597051.1 hypothetical protein [Neptuniibacter sp.]